MIILYLKGLIVSSILVMVFVETLDCFATCLIETESPSWLAMDCVSRITWEGAY